MQSEWISIYSFTVVIISMMFLQSMLEYKSLNRKREAEREIINYIKTKKPRKAQQISVLPKIMHLASDIVVGCERNKFP